jgi:predicted GNAT family acetyltransferase
MGFIKVLLLKGSRRCVRDLGGGPVSRQEDGLQEQPMAETPNVVMNEQTHRFEVESEGQTAFAEYRLKDGVLTLPHTLVPDALGGRGIAGALAEAALGYARANGLLVKPTCPFIASYIGKHPEWRDVLHPDFRPPADS